MTTSIIITTFNNRGLARQLLKGIFRNKPRESFEIIVVDNNSSDGTAAMVREQFPSVRCIEMKKNKGLAAGNNAGMQIAQGEFFLILNPDIAVFDSHIDQLVAFMREHPQAGLVGPKLQHPDKSLQYSTYRFPDWYTPVLRRTPLGKTEQGRKKIQSYLMKEWDHNTDQKVDWVLGAAMMVRAEALQRVGLQDERFFLYYEDVDWCRRFWEKGYEVWYASSIPFIHYHRRESADHPGIKGLFNITTKIHIMSWFIFLRKYGFKKTTYQNG